MNRRGFLAFAAVALAEIATSRRSAAAPAEPVAGADGWMDGAIVVRFGEPGGPPLDRYTTAYVGVPFPVAPGEMESVDEHGAPATVLVSAHLVDAAGMIPAGSVVTFVVDGPDDAVLPGYVHARLNYRRRVAW